MTFEYVKVALLMASVLAVPAQARVARTTLVDLARNADAIVIARVEGVPSFDGLPVARAVPTRVLKGNLGQGPLHFVAGPTWSCDMSTAVRGETVLLFLNRAETDRFSRKGYRQPGARVPVKPLYTLAHSGRGRMPLRTVQGRTHVVLPFDVEAPGEVPVVPGKRGGRALSLERALGIIRTQKSPVEPRGKA